MHISIELAKDQRLLFVGNEQGDDIAPGGGLRDTHDTKARAQCRLLISIVAVADRDLGLPALVTFYVSEYGSLTPYIVLLYS